MADLPATPTAADNNPAPPSPVPQPPPPGRHKPIIGHCIVFTMPTFLGFLMVIFLAIPALMTPEFCLDPGSSSLSSLNISTSHVTARWNIALSVKNPSKLIAVEYADMKLLLSFGGELRLSRPSLIPTFAQGPHNSTTVRAEALSMLPIVNNLGVKGLVLSLKGGEVAIDVVAKAKRRLRLGPWWVPVLDVYFSCMGVTFTAPNCSEGGGDWMILGGTLHCEPDIFTLLWVALVMIGRHGGTFPGTGQERRGPCDLGLRPGMAGGTNNNSFFDIAEDRGVVWEPDN